MTELGWSHGLEGGGELREGSLVTWAGDRPGDFSIDRDGNVLVHRTASTQAVRYVLSVEPRLHIADHEDWRLSDLQAQDRVINGGGSAPKQELPGQDPTNHWDLQPVAPQGHFGYSTPDVHENAHPTDHAWEFPFDHDTFVDNLRMPEEGDHMWDLDEKDSSWHFASNIAQQAVTAAVNKGGVTIALDGTQPHEGYAYSPYPGVESKLSPADLGEQVVDAFIHEHHDQLSQPGHFLGIWNDDTTGLIYIDVVVIGPADESTLDAARNADQLAVFDIAADREIRTGLDRDQPPVL